MKTSSIPGCSKAVFLLAYALALAPAAQAQAHKYAYVTNNFSGNSITVIDTDPSSGTFDTVVATITTTGAPFGIALSPDNTRAYVTDNPLGTSATNTVEVIDINPNDTSTYNKVVATVNLPTGASPNLLAFTPDGSLAAVALSDHGAQIEPISTALPLTTPSAATTPTARITRMSRISTSALIPPALPSPRMAAAPT
jgi:DNA-binding beta-propeller fold protein YncE